MVLLGQVWEVVEHSKQLASMTSFDDDIPGIHLDTTVLTFPQRHIYPLSDCMCELIRDEQLPELFDEIERKGGKGVDIFPSEPVVPVELQDAPMVGRGTAGGHQEQPESVWVNGKELSRESKVPDLQDGCNYLGINASGPKAKLYDRLCAYFSKQYQKDIERAATHLQKLEKGSEVRTQEKKAERPSDPNEVERHEVTHLPFAAWREACLETKSREDRTIQSTDAEVEDPGVPHIQMDWMYLGRSCP